MFKFKNILFWAIIINSILSQAQTSTIANKSRSNPISNHAQDQVYSNFGMAPQRYVQAAKLDTLIFLNDSLTVMVTSRGQISIPYRRDTSDMSFARESGLWKPGRDTVKNHPLFNLQKPEIEIRVIVEDDYNFINSADSIIFIYYQEPLTRKQIRKAKRKKKKKNSFIPLWFKKNPGSFFFILIILSLFTFRRNKQIPVA